MEDAEKSMPEAPVTSADEMPDPNQRPDCFRSTVEETLFVLTATMAVSMTSFLQGLVIVISSFAGADLDMSTAQITWITASSSLTSGAFLLFFGKVADMFGRRAMFIGSLFLFAIFALVTGFSKSAMALDVLNGVLGLISAAAVPPAQGILGNVYEKPSKRKNYAFACFSAGNPLGFVFGSIFSGIATQLFDWRASFFLLAIIYLVFSVIAVFTVPTDNTSKLPFTVESLKKFDVVGTALTVGGIGLFSTALSLGGDAVNGWTTPYVLAFLFIGALLLVGFVFWELYYEYPLVPMGIWKDREFSLLMGILLLGFLAFPPMDFWLALYMQRVEGYSALQTAVHFLPMAISGTLVNIVAGLILHKVSNKFLMGLGAASYTVAFLLLAVHRHGNSYWAFIFPALILVVWGADFEFNVANMYVISSLDKSQQSIGGSIFQTTAKLCVTVGVGISTAIFNAVSESPSKSGYYANNPYEPYAAVAWYCMGCAVISVLLVPFLRIKTQG
ncbi:aminotriazole resistance protein [Pseudovirgaria hyperparasitica]|uniref:Aminotriazole resistance protein n=1 Tax=Pseudovirgaria hyperparasitica TaxID=470096 RepID=A0A6A6VYB3_9PEZI|nr:aminotriazole resistance protein [Pseudovirgaria hyperparasitica]KAF2755648.1 aminotriazole resistance protein [Pseudovirgaria hyperparasitica]